MRPIVVPRRTFLKTLNLAASGLALGVGLPGSVDAQALEKSPSGVTANVFVHVAPDGLVSIVCHRSEMGQGIRSSLPVLIADELGADMARVRIVQADGNKAYGDQNTDGSNSIRGIYEDMRRAGATARVMLVAAAAKKLGVPASECRAEAHRVTHERSKRALEFGELATLAAKAKVPGPEQVTLRPREELKHVGTALPLVDAHAYVTGSATFGADVRLPNMLTAVIARPKTASGKVVRFDASRAQAVPGVKRVLEMPAPTPPYKFQPWGGVAVVAEHTWAALKGRAALDITWDAGEHAVYDSLAYKQTLRDAVHEKGEVLRKSGDVEKALAGATRTLEAEYHVPHLPHLPMEPLVAVAHVTGDRCEIWAPTQNPQAAQTEVARVLGIPEAQVVVHVTFLGGGFGRKSKADYVGEAALLAREMGVPVRLQFTREDDVQHDYVNTVATNLLTAGLDANGKVVGYRLRTAFPSIQTVFGGAARPSAGDLQQGVLDLALSVPNVAVEACEVPAHVRIGWLRSVYNIFQAFSFGSFVDELAVLRGTDVVDTWLELLGPARKASLEELGIDKLKNYGQPLDKHPVDVGRLRNVLERVAKSARFAEQRKAGRALGIACHRSFLSYTAVVVSVARRPSGKIAVDEAWIAFDAGTVVNTDRVRSQLEGSVVFGMSLALYGGITMKNGAIEQNNFRGGGRLVRMPEVPPTHVELVQSDAPPGGVGEPGVPPVAPALANAVFALTGKRARELPLSRTFEV